MKEQITGISKSIPDLSALREIDFSQAEHRSVVILGGGPAGLTAALYAARANLAPLVLQGTEPGGQLITTTDVENYPGFPDGLLGPVLMDRFEAQAVRFEAELRYGMVTVVDFSQRPFRLLVEGETPLLADAVIIATGASAKYLGLVNEQRLIGHGVSACATCDGAFFKEQDVAVIGGGDTAMEEALFLTRFASRVFIIHRRDQLRASKIMQQRALTHPKITAVWNTAVEDVLGEQEVEGLVLKHAQTGELSTLSVTGMFVAIGHKPNTEIFKGWLEIDSLGYILTRPGSTTTNIPGVFACGDVQDHVYRQAVTAAGTGAMAAIDAERWLTQHVLANG
ncbi:MAG: thioredoxin-disulfide reductase [Candidatus Tectomicrobia bacterium]|nr:thioredoxin-disulfide reductase [Candidatus Tectomicrobia bacterium]